LDTVVDVNGYDPEGYYWYIMAQVLLQKVDKFKIGTVVRTRVDENGNQQVNPIRNHYLTHASMKSNSMMELC
jgi:hypothetical protein